MEAVSTGLSPTMTVPSDMTPITNRPANSTPLMARASDAAVKGMERDMPDIYRGATCHVMVKAIHVG